MDSSLDLELLQVFAGESNPAEMRVYARLASPGQTDPAVQLSGVVEGPRSELAHTLPATIPLRDLGPGASYLAQAIVPDPCFWSPGAPFLYRVHVELRRDGKTLAKTVREVGLKMLGASGRRLLLEGKNWVLRGAKPEAADAADLAQWRENRLAMLAPARDDSPQDDSPQDDSLCERASRAGVLLVAHVNQDQDVTNELRRLARCPAVGFAMLDRQPLGPEEVRQIAPNLLLGQRFLPDEEVQPAAWAQVAFCEVDQSEDFAARVKNCVIPVLAIRQRPAPTNDAVAVREGCDRLQRDLAGAGPIAGYLV